MSFLSGCLGVLLWLIRQLWITSFCIKQGNSCHLLLLPSTVVYQSVMSNYLASSSQEDLTSWYLLHSTHIQVVLLFQFCQYTVSLVVSAASSSVSENCKMDWSRMEDTLCNCFPSFLFFVAPAFCYFTVVIFFSNDGCFS